MGNQSRYWIEVRLDRLGHCRAEAIEAAKCFFEEQFAVETPDRQIQRQLVQWLRNDDQRASEAEQCLRCFISHEIRQVCLALAQKFGAKHDFSSAELLPYALDSFSSTATPVSEATPPSLTERILNSFDPDKSNLSTWTARLVRSDKEVQRFLLEHGIEQKSDWLMLCQRSPGSVQRLLSEFYQQTPAEVERAVQLLTIFHQIYHVSLMQQRQQRGRARPYPPPTREQLQQIALRLSSTQTSSPEEILAELQTLTQCIRAYRIQAKGGQIPPSMRRFMPAGERQGGASAEEGHEDDDGSNRGEPIPNEDNIEALLAPYRDDCLRRAVAQTTRTRIAAFEAQKGQKAQQQAAQKIRRFLRALHLFHCRRMAMGDIATQLGFKAQYQVSRLLDLKAFRADIGRRLLQCLTEQIQTLAQQTRTPERLHDLDRRLAEFLAPQVDRTMREAEKEATTNKDLVQRSQLSQALCRYLDTEFDFQEGEQ